MAVIKFSNEAVDLKAQAIADALDGGTLEIYTSPEPANANAVEAGTTLAIFDLASPAFGTPSNGVITANNINDTVGLATGTANHWRAFGAGSPHNVILQGTCGTSLTPMILNSTAIAAGGAVSAIGWTHTEPKG